MPRVLSFWPILILFSFLSNAHYSEILSLSVLNNANIDVRYTFVFNNTLKTYTRILSSGVSSRFNNYGDAPTGLIKLYSQSEVRDISLTMATGAWRIKEWGPSVFSTPSGGLFAAVRPRSNTLSGLDSIWPLLSSMLSVSTNSHRRNTKVHPLQSPLPIAQFRDNYTALSTWEFATDASRHLPQARRAGEGSRRQGDGFALQSSRKGLCVDNIQRALQLLPCQDKQGLGRFVDPSLIVRAPWFALTLQLSAGAQQCRRQMEGPSSSLSVCSVDTTTTVELGFVWTGAAAPLVPQPGESEENERRLVLDSLQAACRVSTAADKCSAPSALSLLQVLQRSGSSSPVDIEHLRTHSSSGADSSARAGGVLLTSSGDLSGLSVPLATSQSDELLREVLDAATATRGTRSPAVPPMGVTVRREVVDSRSLAVDISTRVTNTHPFMSVEVQLTEPVIELLHPWWHRYVYALSPMPLASPATPSSSGRVLDRLDSKVLQTSCDNVHVYSLPHLSSRICASGAYSISPAVMSRFVLPPYSELVVRLPLQKRFISREVQQTDASRGLDIPPAIVHYRYVINCSIVDRNRSCTIDPERSIWHVILTESWLVTLPFPDASMPFNVITLTCTVAALLFGSAANSLVRKSSLKAPLKSLVLRAGLTADSSPTRGGAMARWFLNSLTRLREGVRRARNNDRRVD